LSTGVRACCLAGALLLVSACAHPTLLDDPTPPDQSHELHGLKRRVVVFRDEHAIPYIVAESLEDALRAQGYVTAHDRLYQLEFMKTIASGRLSEWIGERGLPSDRMVRGVGIPELGRRQAPLLSKEERRYFLAYLEGINTYIESRGEDHAPGLAKIGVAAKPWTLEEMLGVQFFQIWSSSVNWREELLTQQLIDKLGPEPAREISQLSVNPDDESDSDAWAADQRQRLGLRVSSELHELPRASTIGSNAWAVDAAHSQSGGALLASDPHLEAVTLPGFWHPAAIVTPELRAVGGGTPGTPGFGIARTEHIAYGATNGYADGMDLFIESEDPEHPGHYLEGDRSIPFQTREETIRVRDRKAPSGFRSERLSVRSTRRGPIVSDLGMQLEGGKLLSLRWSVPEQLRSELGARELLSARSVKEARAAIAKISVPLNHVVVDHRGNIARISSGDVPIRTRGDGSAPTPVGDGSDSWAGFIPQSEMPSVENPLEGWVGAANHRVAPGDYPYAYSTYFSPSWRYRRLLQLFDGLETTSAAEQWRFQRDEKNVMAERIVPMLVEALRTDPATQETAEILASWDFFDSSDSVAALLFQASYRQFAHRTFRDELGGELSARLLESWYYWHERLERMLQDPNHPWFDDVRTDRVETRDDLFRLAARDARDELRAELGEDPASWSWGRLHSVEFSSPVRAARSGGGCPGGGKHAVGGSGETLTRALYRFARPYEARVIASMRFVADFGDPDKVRAVIPGGVSGRCGNPHTSDQVGAWLSGEEVHWWFSDEAIRAHAVSKEQLLPPGAPVMR
jgi:penicillin amidase